ncbi:MAG: hypothetical protein VXY89_07575, partial [SAR324 cluster bacterium]|nr:hypothetical protein [SAR324 cluster bacterium]
RAQSTPGDADDGRKIWTAMPGASYFNDWDNFSVKNTSAITNLFDLLGVHSVQKNADLLF